MLDLAVVLLLAALCAAVFGYGHISSGLAPYARPTFAALALLYCAVLVARQRLLSGAAEDSRAG